MRKSMHGHLCLVPLLSLVLHKKAAKMEGEREKNGADRTRGSRRRKDTMARLHALRTRIDHSLCLHVRGKYTSRFRATYRGPSLILGFNIRVDDDCRILSNLVWRSGDLGRRFSGVGQCMANLVFEPRVRDLGEVRRSFCLDLNHY